MCDRKCKIGWNFWPQLTDDYYAWKPWAHDINAGVRLLTNYYPGKYDDNFYDDENDNNGSGNRADGQ